MGAGHQNDMLRYKSNNNSQNYWSLIIMYTWLFVVIYAFQDLIFRFEEPRPRGGWHLLSTMSAISSVPVEVWQSILQYAVEVPHFLDPDAYEGVLSKALFLGSASPLNDERAYWSAEKTRNQMQLVSKSWDLFLRQFEHRFIRMLDIRHRKVALQKLETAIRVSFRECNCNCVEFCANSSVFGFILEALEQVGSTGAEIIETPDTYILLQWLNSPKLKNIKTLVFSRHIYKHQLSSFLNPLPSLRHFYDGVYYGTSDIERGERHIWSNLVTIAFSIIPGEEYDPIIHDFPCLRHLCINSDARSATVEFTKGDVLSILRVVGSQLRSFYLHHVPPGNETLGEVWDLCPNMETFHTAFSLVSPPLNHPIDTLHLHRVEQMKGLESLADWPNLRKIVLRCKWNAVDFQKTDSFVLSREKLRVEDREGLTLDEYYQPS
jgi:hypothetical protein